MKKLKFNSTLNHKHNDYQAKQLAMDYIDSKKLEQREIVDEFTCTELEGFYDDDFNGKICDTTFYANEECG